MSKTEANERYDMKESMDSLKRWWQRMGFRKGLSIITKYGQCELFDYLQYNPVKGSSYTPLPTDLKHSTEGLINIKNKDYESFRWCQIRFLNPQGKDPQIIKRDDRHYINELDYFCIEFPVSIKQYNKIEKRNSIDVKVFGYEEKLFFPISFPMSKEKFTDVLNLLLITGGEEKHYVLIKDFNSLIYNKIKHKARKSFCMHCFQSQLRHSQQT